MTKLYLDDELIDLYGESGISINYLNSNIDSLAQGDTKGSFSYEIKIPATKNNKKILYFPELVLEESFDDELQKEALLEVNGDVILSGYARIKGVIKLDKLIEYKIVLFEGNSSWIYNIKDKSLRDIDYSFFDHKYEVNKQLAFPTNPLVSYPLINYGTPVKGEGNWSVEDRYPAFNIRRIIQDIFFEAGYTVDSDFIDTDFFKQLYLTTDKVPERRESDYLPWRFKVGNTNSVQYWSYNGDDRGLNKDIVIAFNKDVLTNDVPFFNTDNTGVVNLGTTDCNYYNVDFKGRMSFVWEYAFFNVSDAAVSRKSVDYTLRLWRRRNGVDTILESRDLTLAKAPVTGGVINSTNTTLGTFTSKSYDVESEDRYFFTARLLDSTIQDHFTGVANDNIFKNKVYSTVVEGGDIYIEDNIPEILQTDFIQDIKTMFNLYFYTDEVSKKVTIEPRNDFYTGDAIDWSDKIDLSKPIQINHLGDNLGKEIEFSYAKDSNDKYIQFKENTYNDGNEWLSKTVSITNLNAKDSTTKRSLKSIATTFVGAGIDTAPSAKIPIIWDTESEEPPTKRVKKWKPRILYYRGKVNLYGTEKWKYDGTSFSWYPQFTTNYVATSGVFKHENSLDWNESNYGQGLYNLYYDNTINTINNSRRFIAYIKLNSLDIINLNFRTPIYIEVEGNGNYYHLEKVNGYKPESINSVQCEFVQVTEDAVTVDKYVSPINVHEYPAKAEDQQQEQYPEEVFLGYDVVYTEKQWQSTTDVPSGEFVDVYAEVKHNKTDSLGNIFRGIIETVQYG